MLDQCLQHFCENVSPGVGRVFLETQAFQVSCQGLFEKPKEVLSIFKWFWNGFSNFFVSVVKRNEISQTFKFSWLYVPTALS